MVEYIYLDSLTTAAHWRRLCDSRPPPLCVPSTCTSDRSHFCLHLHGAYGQSQETAATVDSANSTVRRSKCDQRYPSATQPMSSTLLGISVETLAGALRPHLLSPKMMWDLGYPMAVNPSSNEVVAYISPPPRPRPRLFSSWNCNVDAPEFIPGVMHSQSDRRLIPRLIFSDGDNKVSMVEHLCVRCDKLYRITCAGDHIDENPCSYHWGRVNRRDASYTCCNQPFGTRGCSSARFHVWRGTYPGLNGPLHGYVRARSPRGGVYAIDTEMCYTTAGLELASVALIAANGQPVYYSLVRPNSPVVDLNTRFSGIEPCDLARATKTLKDVQQDLLQFIGIDTILIGHALDNDLRALKLQHSAVVDTCVLYPHARGLPFRRSLSMLSEKLLGRSVQRESTGHSPLEDARAALDLVLLKVQEERVNNVHTCRTINNIPSRSVFRLF